MDTETIEQETGGEVDTGGETYTVQPGDDLRSIAQRFYGDSRRTCGSSRRTRTSCATRNRTPRPELTIPPKAA